MAGEALSPRSGRCERARQWASLRIDGELSELEDTLLEKHLEGCASCGAFAARLTATTEAVRAAPQERPQIDYPRFERPVIRLPVGTARGDRGGRCRGRPRCLRGHGPAEAGADPGARQRPAVQLPN